MCKPHKHAAVIKAWADGAKIEWRVPGDKNWTDTPDPKWYELYEYRVKPTPLTLDECCLKAAWDSNLDLIRRHENSRADFMKTLIQLLKENNHV